MTLQTSGPITLDDVATEFLDTGSSSLSEFYSGGSLVTTNIDTFTGTASSLSVLSDGFGYRPAPYSIGPSINSNNALYYHSRWCDGCSQSGTVQFTVDLAGQYTMRMGGFLQASGQYTNNQIWVNGTKLHDFTVPYTSYGNNFQDKLLDLNDNDVVKLVVYMSALGNTWQSTSCALYGTNVGSNVVTTEISGLLTTNIPVGGEISLSNFYGESRRFSVAIDTDTADVDLYDYAVTNGWDENAPLEVVIDSGVYVYSTSTSNAAITASDIFPSGVTIINNGYIVGKGGAAGTAGTFSNSGYGGNGGDGGTALSTSVPITINNSNGTIAGGGGGGAGGGIAWCLVTVGEGQIGGGANGGAGAKGRGYTAAGTGTAGGEMYQADGSSYAQASGGDGGDGGDWGTAGSAGTAGSYSYSGNVQNPTTDTYVRANGTAGAAGAAVSGNSNITWAAAGTIEGAQS